MASNELSADELKSYKMAFQILDKDNDGKISRDQFEEILRRAVGGAGSTEDVELILKEMNADENGNVNFAGFLSAMLATKDDDMSAICCSAEDILKDLGAGKDKSMGVSDWKQLLDSLGICFTEEEIEAVIRKVTDMAQAKEFDDDDESYETIETTSGETSAEEDEENPEQN